MCIRHSAHTVPFPAGQHMETRKLEECELWQPGCHTCPASPDDALLPTTSSRVKETEMNTDAKCSPEQAFYLPITMS